MQPKPIKWLCVLILADFGIVMGVLSVNGLTQKLEPYLWLLFGIISAYVLVKKVRYRLFFHSVLLGVLWAVVNALIQVLFFDSFLANNPADALAFEELTVIEPKIFVLLFSPIYGLLMGIVIGVLSLLLKKILSPKA
ncbi:MAG: hypothetical protein AB3N14_02000 [Flavobacteriaceae bacterium]